MPKPVKAAFQDEALWIPMEKILPLKKPSPDLTKTRTYKRVVASINEIGVIEPLVVYPQAGKDGNYSLLDGQVRFEVLKARGDREVLCLIATEDEAYTYNHKVNQVTPIQEHFMILKAVESGVSEQRIAAALDVNVKSIREKRDLLQGTCPEAVQLLRDRRCTAGAIREIRKVKPIRQIEMAELMIAAHNFSAGYAKCLFAATPQEQLVDSEKAKEVDGLSAEDISRMEKEMEGLSRDFKALEESHGRNVLTLVLASTYLRKLMDNAAVLRFLSQRQPDILAEFQKIVDAGSLETGQ